MTHLQLTVCCNILVEAISKNLQLPLRECITDVANKLIVCAEFLLSDLRGMQYSSKVIYNDRQASMHTLYQGNAQTYCHGLAGSRRSGHPAAALPGRNISRSRTGRSQWSASVHFRTELARLQEQRQERALTNR